MIPCRFKYKFPTGGASDSLDQVYNVHSVPSVGDTLFIGGESEVKEVVHFINPTERTHEILVYYGDKVVNAPSP